MVAGRLLLPTPHSSACGAPQIECVSTLLQCNACTSDYFASLGELCGPAVPVMQPSARAGLASVRIMFARATPPPRHTRLYAPPSLPLGRPGHAHGGIGTRATLVVRGGGKATPMTIKYNYINVRVCGCAATPPTGTRRPWPPATHTTVRGPARAYATLEAAAVARQARQCVATRQCTHTPPHSLQRYRARPCSQMPDPPHSLQLYRSRPWAQMLPPPHTLQR